jgi:mono/diheme cytochrome c family protein
MSPVFRTALPIITSCLLAGCDRASSTVALSDSATKQTAADDAPISFNESIQPILSENCYHCHGPDSGTREPKKAPLRLDREKFAFQKREDGKPVMIPGDAGASLLVKLIKSKNPDDVMPPVKSHNQLKPEQIALLERWVAQGAKYEEHWSFIPPKRPAVPLVAKNQLVKNPVDAFIEEKLEQSHLTLQPQEDPRALIRRTALDLTGLLPDSADVEKFAKDPSDAAYAAYQEKLFATPARLRPPVPHVVPLFLSLRRFGVVEGFLHIAGIERLHLLQRGFGIGSGLPQPTSDNRPGAADTTPTVDVNRLWRRLDHIQNFIHQQRRLRNPHIGNGQRNTLERKACFFRQAGEQIVVGRHIVRRGGQIDKITDAFVNQMGQAGLRVFRRSGTGVFACVNFALLDGIILRDHMTPYPQKRTLSTKSPE